MPDSDLDKIESGNESLKVIMARADNIDMK